MAAADLTTRSRNGSARKSSSSSSSSSSSEGSTSKLSSQKSNPLPSPQLRPRFSLLDVIRILGGVFLLSSALSYFVTSNSIFWGYRPNIASKTAGIRTFIVCFPFPRSALSLSCQSSFKVVKKFLTSCNSARTPPTHARSARAFRRL